MMQNYPTRTNPLNLSQALPVGSSNLERDLVATCDAINTPAVIPTIKNYDAIPAELLDAVAIEISADFYSVGMSAYLKRIAIKSARQYQRKKATVSAVKQVLNSIGQPDAKIIERSHGRICGDGSIANGGARAGSDWATFVVKLSKPVTVQTLALIAKAIDTVKRVSCTLKAFDFSFSPLLCGNVYQSGLGYVCGQTTNQTSLLG